jgi:hypothetical protein
MYHAARMEKRKETAITVYSTVLLDEDSSVEPSATPRYTMASYGAHVARTKICAKKVVTRDRLTFFGSDRMVPMANIHTDMPHVEKTTVVKCLRRGRGCITQISSATPHIPLFLTRLSTHPGIALNRAITAIFNPPSRTTCASNA